MYIICKSYIAVSKYFAVTAVVNNPHEYTNVHIENYVTNFAKQFASLCLL